MSMLHAILLGLVQGLGEFLPISSSAHLVILPWLLKFPDPGLSFDVALHLGTLISLVAYFYRDWLELIRAFFTSLRKKPASWNFSERMIWLLVLGTIPAAIAGKLLEEYVEKSLRHPLLVAAMMAVFGALLYFCDRMGRKTRKLEQVTWKDSLAIGIAQCVALIPGASRSGVTISAGMLRDLNRETAARFSFLLSMPIVAGAAVLKVPKLVKVGMGSPEIVGILVSAVVGYFSIKYMLYFLKNYSFKVYIGYRVIFALVVLGVFCFRKFS